jgi:hypothetical protein
LAGPGELARWPRADGRGGLRGGQRGGRRWALGVGRRAARGGARGTERCPRDLMLGLVRTRQFAGGHGHVPLGWGVTGGKVLDGWGTLFMAGGRNGRFHIDGGAHGYILGPEHYTQSNGDASRMTLSTLDIYIYISTPTHIHQSILRGGRPRGRMHGHDLLAS